MASNRQESEGITLRMMRRSTEHDIEPEAKSVLTSRQRAIQEIRGLVVEKLEGIRSHVYLIGSCARGETSRHSDIDIAIETLDPAPSSLISDIRIMLDQSDIPFFVDVFDFALLEGQFRDEIRKEGVLWTAPKES